MQLTTRQSIQHDPLLSLLANTGKTALFGKRQVIFSVGDRSDALFLIQSGIVKLTVASDEGTEAVTSVLEREHFFGDEALDPERLSRSTNAIALTGVQVVRIHRDTIFRVLRSNPEICAAFMSYLVRQVAHLRQELANTLLYNSEQRLARALLSLVQFGKANDPQAVSNLSQQDLANMIGSTRQRVNALMQRFREMGFVDYSRGLRIHSSIRNVAGIS
jgi:CRP/FNR family transcriptional regulator, cyclic AMP receptor protein